MFMVKHRTSDRKTIVLALVITLSDYSEVRLRQKMSAGWFPASSRDPTWG